MPVRKIALATVRAIVATARASQGFLERDVQLTCALTRNAASMACVAMENATACLDGRAITAKSLSPVHWAARATASVSTVGATVMQIGSVRVAMSEQNAQRAALRGKKEGSALHHSCIA